MSCCSNRSPILSVVPWVWFYQKLCPYNILSGSHFHSQVMRISCRSLSKASCHLQRHLAPVECCSVFSISFSFKWDQDRWGGSLWHECRNLDLASLWDSLNLVTTRSFGGDLVASPLMYGQRGRLQHSNQTSSLGRIVARWWHGAEYIILTRTECEHIQFLNFI